ncbi:MAG TPA: OB-fold nucleic acid binding domain-containing protein, partial [Ktedonobacteraceae bacterium]|nr:OB-fold nucleic acid binding domain-containing protein [Ktedonobacteraceae bacterium]
MQRILTSEIQAHVGERVRVAGWLHSLRQLGGVNFLVIRDGWGLVQAVTEQAAELAPLAGLSVESVIAVEGLVVSEPQAPGGAELHELYVEVITPIQEPPPLPLNKRKINASLNTLLDQAVVMNRHPARRAILRLNAAMLGSFRGTLTERGFTEIQTPKIVEAATESGANVFRLDYFGRS